MDGLDAHALILENQVRHPGARIFRAKVIGRDVALVIDHALATEVLGRDESKKGGRNDGESVGPRFSHRQAYQQLLATFFAEPNILLEDEDERERARHRREWDDHMALLVQADRWDPIDQEIRNITGRHRSDWISRPEINLYESCKDISRDVVFHLFLGVSRQTHPELFDQTLRTSDTSLRGQFSIPLRGSLGLFLETTYSKGLRAQKEFNEIVEERVKADACPFLHETRHTTGMDGEIPHESLTAHLSMFSSSLVIKALASYLTFSLCQLSRLPQPVLANASIDHVLLETERLCPPIIGVLRRVLDAPWTPSGTNVEIPVGWETWAYFPLINRDVEVYGKDADCFRPDRWNDSSLPPPMTFGSGGKTCLGRDLIRSIVKSVLEESVRDGTRISLKDELEDSMLDFLGWKHAEVKGWPAVKQLPVQRPRYPIWMKFEGM
ncbi:hypothetical protein QFC21_007121 [Naganishia friedmannii]|uniref:Uncharacterized protein n=1 Tax=Naganishia friedmannii TaxID=89922 RepID=A0ACC2UYN0_9TREE|nr:hypothetical protein QFC21_007121 [Naganishia friedmannii]